MLPIAALLAKMGAGGAAAGGAAGAGGAGAAGAGGAAGGAPKGKGAIMGSGGGGGMQDMLGPAAPPPMMSTGPATPMPSPFKAQGPAPGAGILDDYDKHLKGIM